MLSLVGNGNSNGASKVLFWLLGIAMMVLFAAVGILVNDIRGDIEDNRRTVYDLERHVLKLQGDMHEERRITDQVRDWWAPRITQLEDRVRQLQKSYESQP